ncbi:hypothetical protein HNR25_004731 [Streptomonospora salina]|uniref:Uncharacterized protein n=1 Tax=Streptomonospora salina TaxID=104205 RepID=A0A841ECR3_9ACTN|nr:hypothetical protein [Streptomonospora salina]
MSKPLPWRRSHVRGCGAAADPLDGGGLEGVDAAAQPCGHDLAQGVQRAFGPVLDAGTGGGGDAQRDDERDGLFVVEQQRRQLRAGVETVSAVGALVGGDGIAQLAQAVDVAAHGNLGALRLEGPAAMSFALPDGVTWDDLMSGTAREMPQWAIDRQTDFSVQPGETLAGILER